MGSAMVWVRLPPMPIGTIVLALMAAPLAHAGPRREPAGHIEPAHPASPWRADAQDAARHEEQAGAIHKLAGIERRVLPKMSGMQYLGPEYDPAAMAYRLKFIDHGRVVFVDVDARTGAVIHETH